MAGEHGLAAVVLAGGAASRLDGIDKSQIVVHGRTLLNRTLAAVAEADPLVVVGPRRDAERVVRWTRESPPGGGPLAAIDAGLRAMPEHRGLVAVLAVDHPWVTAATMHRLRAALLEHDSASGAVLQDDRPQWLVGVWWCEALRAAMPSEVAGRAVRSLLVGLPSVRVPRASGEASDVDTPEDVRQVRGHGFH